MYPTVSIFVFTYCTCTHKPLPWIDSKFSEMDFEHEEPVKRLDHV